MDADSGDRLRACVAESDAVLVEERDSPDPVARRRVAEALRAKARALAKLGRYEERVGVWDEMLVRFAAERAADEPLFVARMLANKGLDQHRSGEDHAAVRTLDLVIEQCERLEADARARLLAARALSLKRDVLMGLQQLDEACSLDGEIIGRFGEAVEPELRGRVAFALAHRAHMLLREHRVEEALRDSDALISRFRAEDDPAALGHIAKVMLPQARSLLQVGSPGLNSVMVNFGVMLAGAVGEGVRFAGQRLPLDHAPALRRLQRLGVFEATTSLSRLRMSAAFLEKRRRAAQSLAISRVIVNRFETAEEPDLQRMVATARILGAAALILLGHLREGFRRFDQLTGSGQEAVAEAFRGQAARLGPENGLLEEIGAVANLAQRARTLGQGDRRIARIALEESMRPGGPGSPASRRATWIARLIGP